MQPSRKQAKNAFTLLEVILAVTVAGAVLAGAATIMVSVSNAWLDRQDRHFFEDHVDGVCEFIQACFISAGTEIAAGESSDGGNEPDENDELDENRQNNENDAPTSVEINAPNRANNSQNRDSNDSESSSLLRTTEDPIGWGKPPGAAGYEDPRLSFSLRDTPPLLIQADDAPVIGIQAFLHFEKDEGLSLLWYTPLQEDSEDIDDLRRTPLSDLVTAVQYVYWDEDLEEWETEDEPREGDGDAFILPRFLKLIFQYEDETKERTITIPVPSRTALIF